MLATAPFLLPYLEVQQRLAVVRVPEEVARYSATLDHYRVALPGLAVPLLLGAIGVIGSLTRRRSLESGQGGSPGSRAGALFTLLVLVLSFWLSLGPVIQSGGVTLDWFGLYSVFYDYVPGFSGLRVPSRFAALFLLFLGLLAAFGIAVIERRSRTLGRVVVAASALLLLRATPMGVSLNQPLPSEGLAPPPAYLTPAQTMPAIYRAVDSLRPGAVLVEFPFGDIGYELRYTYFSALHRRRLMNGYSGVFPPSYLARKEVLARPMLDPPRALAAISGATHAVVHRGGWKDDTGGVIAAWLEATGARVVTEADGAVLYELLVREELADQRQK